MKKIIPLLLLLTIMVPHQNLAKSLNTKTIYGKVVDEDKKPLVGVNITVAYSKVGTTTDQNGHYVLEIKGADKVRLLFEFMGYQAVSRTIYFSRKNRYELNVTMKTKVLEMDAIEVEEKKYEPEVSTFEIEAGELRTIPDFQGDVLRAVKTLPGIGSNNELSNTYHVQGGSSNDNLILLEGIRLPQPRQVRNSYQEGMSPLNPALLKNMQIMTGDFSAAYGEKLYSVLLTEYHQTAARPFQGELELSLINAGLMLEGQLPQDGYWAVAARRSDTRLILSTLQTEGDFRPRFYDVQAILRYPLTPQHQLNLFGILLNNDFQVEPKEYASQYGGTMYNEFRTELEGKEQALFRTALLGLRVESQLTSAIRMRNYITFSNSRENDRVGLSGNTVERRNVNYETGEVGEIKQYGSHEEYRDNQLQESLLAYQNEVVFPLATHVLQFGGKIQRHYFRDQIEEMYRLYLNSESGEVESTQQRILVESAGKLTNHSFVAFGEDNWQVSPLFSVNVGLRSFYFSYNKKWLLSPRLRLKWLFDINTWLSAAWGHYTQPPEYREFRDSEYRLLDDVPTQQGQKAVISYYHQNDNGTVFRAEGYYIRLNELIPYNFEDIFVQYEPEYQASGQTYGLSLYLFGKFNRRLNSWFSYNYMVARQKIPELQPGTVPSPTDQRHTVSMVFQDDMPEVPGMRLHTRVLFGSGYPFSSYTNRQDPETGIYYPVEFRRMGLRMAYYRRLDLGMSYEHPLSKHLRYKIAFEIFNAFDFRNVLSYKIYVLPEGGIERVRNNLSRRIYNVRLTVGF